MAVSTKVLRQSFSSFSTTYSTDAAAQAQRQFGKGERLGLHDEVDLRDVKGGQLQSECPNLP